MILVTILGPGAVGLSLGSLFLSTNSSDTEIQFYPQYREPKRFLVEGGNGSAEIEIGNIDTSSLAKTDLLIVSLKVYDLARISIDEVSLIPPSAVILPICNGISSSDELGRIFPENLIATGVLYISCEREGYRVKNYSEKPKLVIDRVQVSKTQNVLTDHRFLSLCAQAGIELQFSTNFYWELWRKLIITAAINGSCIYFDCIPEEIFSNGPRYEFLRAFVTESARVAQATTGLGYDKDTIEEILNDILCMPGGCAPSMYADFKKNRSTEVAFIHSRIVESAQPHKITTPLNQLVVEKLRLRELCISNP